MFEKPDLNFRHLESFVFLHILYGADNSKAHLRYQNPIMVIFIFFWGVLVRFCGCFFVLLLCCLLY